MRVRVPPTAPKKQDNKMNEALNATCPFSANTPEYKLYFAAYEAHVRMDDAARSIMNMIEEYNKHRTRALAYGRALDTLCEHEYPVYTVMPNLPDVSSINDNIGK